MLHDAWPLLPYHGHDAGNDLRDMMIRFAGTTTRYSSSFETSNESSRNKWDCGDGQSARELMEANSGCMA